MNTQSSIIFYLEIDDATKHIYIQFSIKMGGEQMFNHKFNANMTAILK